MVIDIPTKDEFTKSGLTFLNLAWDSVLSLMLSIEDAGAESIDDVNESYWSAAQISLTTAISLAQQGTEFLLKGRIAEVSPFLLISNPPRDWRTKAKEADTAFADFRTIDAQDLIKVHNMFVKEKLPEKFIQNFEESRRLRNVIMHTVDSRLQVNANNIIQNVLEISHYLVGPGQWMGIRLRYLESNPESILCSEDDAQFELSREFTKVIEVLSPSLMRHFFRFIKRQKRYICLSCSEKASLRNCDGDSQFAQLRPNSVTSTKLHCTLCNTEYKVKRRPCPNISCNGNVIYSDAERRNTCLTCGCQE